MQNLRNDTNALQTQENTNLWLSKGIGGRHKLGVWDKHIHTTTFKIGKQQRPTIQHITQDLVTTYNRKKNLKKNTYMYICMTGHCGTLETNNIVNQLYFNLK